MRIAASAPLLAFLFNVSLTGPLPAQAPASAEDVRFFENRVRPVLAERCFSCHGEKQSKNGLKLTSGEALLRGGYSGPAVVPGKPDESLLLRAVSHTDDQLKMPPRGKLPGRAVADIRQWIARGAAFPAAAELTRGESGETAWAFVPAVDPPLPAVKNTGWATSPIDRFILARLEARKLSPAPPADRRTLIRRLSYDLIGLPPTPAEIDAFLADRSPRALERVVERLLASPHYGERWGRHWLDVARYADSNGLDENLAYGTAWRYRDYVVRSFNQDKPYDRFLTEQLAGDLLPADDVEARNEQLIATGFLSLGPKVLAEPDERKMEMDIIDEQLDTLARAFLGVTLGCARCHDHKFDPISMADYYALAGIFKSTRTMEHFRKIARWHENSLASDEEQRRVKEHEALVAARKKAIADLVKQGGEQAKKKLKPGQALPKNPEPLFPAELAARLKGLREELAKLEKNAPEMPTALGVSEGEVTDLAIHLRGSYLTLGKVVPRRFPESLSEEGAGALSKGRSGRLELAAWMTRPDHPLTARVMVNRIWRWHFGRGIVGTPDNFGKLGEKPTHPELLDWLAHRFVESGWSIKAMHRLIVLSSTYQMSSTFDARAAEVDPENRLWWRQDVRRLEAEPIRDTLLAISGLLDRSVGGSLLTHVKNRQFLFDHTSKDGTTYGTSRRSIYLPVIRNHLYDMFQLFDFPDSLVLNGDRPTTTVAPQALYLMNSDVVVNTAEHLAGGLLGQEGSDTDRLRALYLRAYGRPATQVEEKEGVAFLGRLEQALRKREADAGKRRLQAWTWLCQTVLASNELIHVR